MSQQSTQYSSLGPRDVRALMLKDAKAYRSLGRIGIHIGGDNLRRMMNGIGMDALPNMVTTPSIATPEQFLQNWLPGFVAALTTPREIDNLIGIATVGEWEDEEVIQGILEMTGNARVYADYTNIPMSSWNLNFERRTVVRFEEGMGVGVLEEKRAARVRMNSAATKRSAASTSLEINRNKVGFYGYNNGTNRTYGMMNEPSLFPYITLPAGLSGDTKWKSKTYLEITADIRFMFSTLRQQSKNTIKVEKHQTTMCVSIASIDYLSVTSETGKSVREWLKETYPNCRIECADEFDGANGGEDVVYLYAEVVEGADGSTDDNRVWVQIVPSKFQVIGVEQKAKGYAEDYSNATAGAMLKRPYAVARFTGQ
ncbi:DUF2184 domain-containing protein [Jinshanibacter sp. LJY008]|uniref:DUF2184 domain-containing protein n=1 Tax=Limnobaculum eriocheiris TaxID=2897391 RepID=A0A9X1MV91_9GAMM|nr:major capsid family protein [Limnobaculum eriocheiris]MCD1124815.1 DUF2184 domain-containing protein [Limnobaculum eriocheiris]